MARALSMFRVSSRNCPTTPESGGSTVTVPGGLKSNEVRHVASVFLLGHVVLLCDCHYHSLQWL